MRFDTTVKPIEISLYAKIDQDVRVRIDKNLVDKDPEDLIASSAGLVSFHKVIDASEPRIPGGLPSPGARE